MKKKYQFFIFCYLICLCIKCFSEMEQEENTIIRYGFLVGNNCGGLDTEDLLYSIKDAESMAELFEQIGGIPFQNQYRLKNPTLMDFQSGFIYMDQLIRRSTKKNCQVEFIFYYSGHSNHTGLQFRDKKYSYLELQKQIEKLSADVSIGILDSCNSGALIRSKGGTHSPPFILDEMSKSSGHCYLTSSTENEKSFESDRIEASYFTQALRSGMMGAADTNKDGNVTLNEAYQYAYDETQRLTDDGGSSRQHPSYKMDLEGTGNIVLTNINKGPTRLILEKKLWGTFLIRDQDRNRIAEFFKQSNSELKICLEPGEYEIQLIRNNKPFTVKIRLNKHLDYRLLEKDLTEKSPMDSILSKGSNTHQFFDWSVESGALFPLGVSKEIFNIGIDQLIYIDYGFMKGCYSLGFGIALGGSFSQSQQTYHSLHNFYSFPLLINLKSGIKWDLYQLTLRLGGGAAYNIQESLVTDYTIGALKPMIFAGLGFDYELAELWFIGVFARIRVLFLDDINFSGVIPGLVLKNRL